jgi:hypothetical protein
MTSSIIPHELMGGAETMYPNAEKDEGRFRAAEKCR